jgi:hypothetical protein
MRVAWMFDAPVPLTDGECGEKLCCEEGSIDEEDFAQKR